MPEPIPIAQKLGCDKHAIDSCILVKSSVEKVSAIFKSSIRSVSESDGILALSANKEEKGHRGFLDACLKYLI
jgi:hypothetical protein